MNNGRDVKQEAENNVDNKIIICAFLQVNSKGRQYDGKNYK